jgi:AcrR family transcriptional regulator
LDGLDELAPRADGETQILVCRYVSLSAAYWSTQHYRSSIGRTAHSECDFSPEALKPAVDQRERLLEDYAVHLASGFLRDRWSGNFERVERIAWIQPEELPEVDRIFHSISEVVLDVGYGAATVERIAQHIGLSKSGLYHYFGNKNEMLSQSLIRVQRHIAGLAQHRFRQLETDPERLYAVFVIAASYAFHEPSITITENWLRESNVEVRIPPSHTTELRTIYSFVSDMLSGGRLVGREEDGFAVLSFIFFLANQEVSRLAGGPGYAQRITGLTRNLFRLFTAGVRASLQSNTRNEVHQ